MDKNNKLRKFLTNLDSDTCQEDYTETPIYNLGHEDGYADGYQEAYHELFKVLKAIETLIEPHLER